MCKNQTSDHSMGTAKSTKNQSLVHAHAVAGCINYSRGTKFRFSTPEMQRHLVGCRLGHLVHKMVALKSNIIAHIWIFAHRPCIHGPRSVCITLFYSHTIMGSTKQFRNFEMLFDGQVWLVNLILPHSAKFMSPITASNATHTRAHTNEHTQSIYLILYFNESSASNYYFPFSAGRAAVIISLQFPSSNFHIVADSDAYGAVVVANRNRNNSYSSSSTTTTTTINGIRQSPHTRQCFFCRYRLPLRMPHNFYVAHNPIRIRTHSCCNRKLNLAAIRHGSHLYPYSV